MPFRFDFRAPALPALALAAALAPAAPSAQPAAPDGGGPGFGVEDPQTRLEQVRRQAERFETQVRDRSRALGRRQGPDAERFAAQAEARRRRLERLRAGGEAGGGDAAPAEAAQAIDDRREARRQARRGYLGGVADPDAPRFDRVRSLERDLALDLDRAEREYRLALARGRPAGAALHRYRKRVEALRRDYGAKVAEIAPDYHARVWNAAGRPAE